MDIDGERLNLIAQLAQIAGRKEIKIEKSDEYVPQIIYSLYTGKPCRINGNVENKGLITNLPAACCVEVPCLVDKSGIHPCYVGDLQAVLTGNKDALFQAVAFDPLTSSILTLDEIKKMVDEMLKPEASCLPKF